MNEKGTMQMERLFDKVLITGGSGYCGARLVPQMLSRGYKVTVYDIMFFGSQFLSYFLIEYLPLGTEQNNLG